MATLDLKERRNLPTVDSYHLSSSGTRTIRQTFQSCGRMGRAKNMNSINLIGQRAAANMTDAASFNTPGKVKFINTNSLGRIQHTQNIYTIKNKSLARVTQKTQSTNMYSNSGIRSRPMTSGNNTAFNGLLSGGTVDPTGDLSSTCNTVVKKQMVNSDANLQAAGGKPRYPMSSQGMAGGLHQANLIRINSPETQDSTGVVRIDSLAQAGPIALNSIVSLN